MPLRRWLDASSRQAFRDGWLAASKGRPVSLQRGPLSYNERAAFRDGWHSFYEKGRFTEAASRA